jgi:hypothetical protein
MIVLFYFVLAVLASPFKSRVRLVAEERGASTSADGLEAQQTWVVFGSPTMAACSSSSCIAGFQQSCRLSQSSDLGRSLAQSWIPRPRVADNEVGSHPETK